MLTVRIQEKNYSESIMVLKLKDGFITETNWLLPRWNCLSGCLRNGFKRDRGLTKRIFLHILYSRLKKAWNGKKQTIIRPQRGNVTG